MSDIFTTLAAGTARAQGAAGGETAIRVIDPSPDLARLATGENLRGTVAGRNDHGHLLVRTRLGVLALAVSRALPVGTEVVLQVRNVGPQVMLNLLLLQAAGGAAAAPGQTPQAPAGPADAPALPANPNDLVKRGQLLRAVLHAAPPAPSLAGLPTALPGTELLARILSLGIQSPAPAAPAGPPTAVAPGTAAPPLGVLATPAAAAPTIPLPAVPTIPALPASPAAAPGGGPADTLEIPLASMPSKGLGTGAATPPASPGLASKGSSGAAANSAAAGPPSPPGAVPAGPASLAPALPSLGRGEPGPGLRLAPQTPVANSGHSLATALQGLSSEAAAKAAGTPAGSATAARAASGIDPAAGPAANLVRVTGLVTATTSSGQPILHTPLGTLTLDTRQVLPPGTSLALEITLPAAAGPAVPPGLAATWPSLENLGEALLHGLPAGQAEAVARALPQVGPRLASGVLFFLSALNQGNVAGWLSKAGFAGAQSDRGELSERLGREFAGLSRSIETPAGEWRLVNLPLWSDQGLRELRFYFRHQDHGGRQGEDGEKATRFVLELELKHHGALQLDGLVRARLFDLILRSRRPLPALVRGDLMALFEEANAIAGYNGRLVFQASSDWMDLLAARGATAPHEGLKV
ncbi:MAG: hypothetical protein GEU89_07110 [Kiloniellaceae bacterium]|nr:hypothetical protein [Kiloniellaceae bacterium]